MFIDVFFSAVNHVECSFTLKVYLKYGFPNYIKCVSWRPYRLKIINHCLAVYKSFVHMLVFNLLYRTICFRFDHRFFLFLESVETLFNWTRRKFATSALVIKPMWLVRGPRSADTPWILYSSKQSSEKW